MTEAEKLKHHNVTFLKQKAEKIKTAMVTSYTVEKGFKSRPMATADIDPHGNLWFFTEEYHDEADEVSVNNQIAVTYADSNGHTFLSIKGKAVLIKDKELMNKLWNPFIKTFFPNGPLQSNLMLLKVESSELEYWESSKSKIVLFFNILKTNILGELFDEGEHGKIKF